MNSSSVPARRLPRVALALFAVCLGAASLRAGPAENRLMAAAKAGDPHAIEAALAEGANANAVFAQGEMPLMAAVASGKFPAIRTLLWAGADATAQTSEGHVPLEFLPEECDDRMASILLLRCYAFLRANGQPVAGHVAHPELALIMEDTVNYLHPVIKAAYAVNVAERDGKPGVDDDKNGYVDDVYGWNPVTEKPYAIGQEQLAAYLRNREIIGRIIRIETDHHEGRLSAEAAEQQLAQFTNPLAQIMGPHPDLTDLDFLKIVKSAAHGSHVAGIILANSEGRARLSTLAIQSVGNTSQPFGVRTTEVLAGLFRASTSPQEFLQAARTKILEESFALGRRYSRYIATTGAGVANLSFGFGFAQAERTASFLLTRYIAERQKTDADYEIDEEAAEALAKEQASEIYVAQAAIWATVFYENPDVLFVCAAGNEDEDNDATFGEPGYFSRFFPNVITVASVGATGKISGFSDYGRHSVNLAAIGEGVLSTVIPEASVYMDGTSMAAPAVTGAAALVRVWRPALRAAEVRRTLEYTASSNERLQAFCTSGGALDRDALKQLFHGTPAARAEVRAGMTATAVIFMDTDNAARARRDADAFSQAALKESPGEAASWWGRAMYFHFTDRSAEARPFIDKAVKLAPANRRYWTIRGVICESQGDAPAAVESYSQGLALAAVDENASPSAKATLLVRRATAYLQLKNAAAATADVKAALELVPDATLPDELKTLAE